MSNGVDSEDQLSCSGEHDTEYVGVLVNFHQLCQQLSYYHYYRPMVPILIIVNGEIVGYINTEFVVEEIHDIYR